MGRLDHYDYYIARAGSCRLLARRAVSPDVAAMHREMATMYEDEAAAIATGLAEGEDGPAAPSH